MNGRLAFLIVCVSLASAAPPKPKLVLASVVDQFRYDYLLCFRGEYKEDLDELLTRGAVFTNAYYEHFPTVIARSGIARSSPDTWASPGPMKITGTWAS